MDTERVSVPALRQALAAACPALSEGTAADAVSGVVPSLVASPGSTAEAAALLRAAASFGLTVVPRGAGTGMSWGAPPSSCDLVVDLRSMDQVLEHAAGTSSASRSEEHSSELQSHLNLVCRLLLEKKKEHTEHN